MPSEHNDIQLDSAQKLVAEFYGRDLNEADTRHKIIDVVLHDILVWPRNAVDCESFIDPGYADYKLKKRDGTTVLFIEAKKSGFYFNLPIPFDDKAHSRYFSIKLLLTDPNINQAIEQVKKYCIEEGCEFGGITNGHEWIFFKAFEKGKSWKTLKSFVISSLQYFCDSYIEAFNKLSYTAVIERNSLPYLLGSSFPQNREIHFPKAKITAYHSEVNANNFAPYLRPLVDKYFGVIDQNDPDFMENCYVSNRTYFYYIKTFRRRIYDNLSPYFRSYNIKELRDGTTGGLFGREIEKSVKNLRARDVVILCGGKGSGKSTFLKRLLFHKVPPFIKNYSKICIIDLLKKPENTELIYEEIWSQLVKSLDTDQIMQKSRDELLELFSDRFELAKRQALYGIEANTETYNIRLNDLVAKWILDKKYCAKKLSEYWKTRHKGLIIVLDNTDQFQVPVQDFCFSAAQELAEEIDCLVIISMREERFYISKIHGLLDAFQTSAFHISSPSPQEVFQKRVLYISQILAQKGNSLIEGVAIDNAKITALRKFFRTLDVEFSKSYSPLNTFLGACTHGDIRLALDLFGGFLISGYTNVDEMISRRGWVIQIHQVLKPMMIPNRFFYDESHSSIPNLYQVRTRLNGSHFTALRILRDLIEGVDPNKSIYFSLPLMIHKFVDTYNMAEDCKACLDMLLQYGLIEANNRLDYYTEELDSVRVTPYGHYVYEHLSLFFTYLDLVCMDCGIFEESTANFLIQSATNDYHLFLGYRKYDRVLERLKRVKTFIKYLSHEEKREVLLYSLSKTDLFTERLNKNFFEEEQRIIASAKRLHRRKMDIDTE